ncbi:uncharacterized protein LOC122536314 isoform X2 [Frieseomelitta varia]|uniref:uncharacterized protein LOC122536314 isoform X2 n=1 Tax=Frieseomelitta varia TaxID=561572 RepID=UPI001CB6876B|nr:uncharacterized protein LOC122536314 isoform X2 [Frieseomelitta varia]
MALRMQQDYHTIGDPGRYPLRILRHGEKNCFQTYNHNIYLDVSKINCKEDFLHCIGLQRKQSQRKYKIINSGREMKRINIPNSVILRDCSIVILGVACELCGKCFKCETDLNIHISLKHKTYEEIYSTNIKRTQWTRNEIEVCEKLTKSFNNTTIESTENFGITKERKMLCLTLKIGEEVIAKKLMKRKYLKKAFDDMEIQIESGCKTKLIADKNVRGSTVSCIDPVVFNSRCQCCNPSVHAIQCSNRYLASNIVASEQVVREKIIAREKIDASNRLKESCAIPENKNTSDVTIHGAPKTPFVLNMSFVTENCNIHEVSDSEKCNWEYATSTSSSDTLMLNEPCHKPQFTTASNRILNCDKKSDSVTSLPNDTYTQPVNINTENITEHTKQEDNTNQKHFTLNKMDKYISKNLEDDSQTIHLILPLIMPIVVPNASIPSSPINVTIRATSTEQRKQPQQREQLQLQQEPEESQEQSQLEQQQKQITKDSTIEDNSDDDVQEVLRIIRRSEEIINQESPTRLEREMLVQVAIKDMKRMEELGLHLLEKVIDCTKKKKRSKPNGKSSDTNDDCAKEKKKRIITESNGGCRNQTKEKHTSGMKEHVVPDSVKENLMTYNENIDIAEMIRRYGANYYNEASKIHNNAQSVQEPVSRFLVPSSGGMENRSNGPIVIDLVNGADE